MRCMMGALPEQRNYLIAVYVVVAILVLVFITLIVYVCYLRQFKLNWFERTFLEEHKTSNEKVRIYKPKRSSSSSKKKHVHYGTDALDNEPHSVNSYSDYSVKGTNHSCYDLWDTLVDTGHGDYNYSYEHSPRPSIVNVTISPSSADHVALPKPIPSPLFLYDPSSLPPSPSLLTASPSPSAWSGSSVSHLSTSPLLPRTPSSTLSQLSPWLPTSPLPRSPLLTPTSSSLCPSPLPYSLSSSGNLSTVAFNQTGTTLLSPAPSPRQTPSRSHKTSHRGSLSTILSKLGWVGPALLKMGSSPSSPTSDSEKFWVPPAVIERKRAQSLTPAMFHAQNSSEDVSGSDSATPNSVAALKEFAFQFESGKFGCGSLGGSLGSGMDSPPPQPPIILPGSQQRRRASMHDAIDHTKIDAKLYQKIQMFHQQPVTSIQEENLGSVNFSLDYDTETAFLTVRLIQARDLVARDASTRTVSPYCKLCLLPGRRNPHQSKVHHGTLFPEFEEEFIFEVPNGEPNNVTLELLLFDYDQYSRDECIGQVQLPLDAVDLSDKVTLWKGISAPEKGETKEHKSIGDLMFSLAYLSSAERLTVTVAKARNIHHSDDVKGTSALYTKVTLIHEGKKLKRKKTSVKHGTSNPIWNESLVFNIGRDLMQTINLQFSILHDTKIGTDVIVGHVTLSASSKGDELAHWCDMEKMKPASARWHKLKL